MADESSNTGDKIAGKAKEVAGSVTGDEADKRAGEAQQEKAAAREKAAEAEAEQERYSGDS